MKIVHLSTNGSHGGAGKAAWRLSEQLRRKGHDSILIGLRADEAKEGFLRLALKPETVAKNRWFQALFIDHHRTSISNTWFSTDLFPSGILSHPLITGADIVHLHWVAGFLSISDVAKLLGTGKPIVWTFHDMAAFTGGCHYSAGCSQFTCDCGDCPQIDLFQRQFPAAVLTDKRRSWQWENLTPIVLSEWMRDCVLRSKVLAQTGPVLIRNGIDLEFYSPARRERARAALGVDSDTLVFLFVAEAVNEKRKGFQFLLQALALATPHLAPGKIKILALGRSQEWKTEIPVHFLGWIEEEDRIADVYSAADAFLITSVEDNLPNTVVESLATGTPVIGFAAGGVPDMVENEVTGKLVPNGDAAALAEVLSRASLAPEWLRGMRTACRAAAERDYSGEQNSQAVIKLYERLVSRTPNAERPTRRSGRVDSAIRQFLRSPNRDLAGLAPQTFLLEAIATHEQETVDLRADYERRRAVIETQGKLLASKDAEIDRRLSELKLLYPLLETYKNERNLLAAQLVDLKQNFAAAEADRLARGEVIEKQGQRQTAREKEIDQHLVELTSLYPKLEIIKNERNLLAAQLADLKKNFDAVEADRIERGQLIEELGRQLAAREAEIDRHLTHLHSLYPKLETVKNERNLLAAQLADLKRNFDAVEADRIERGQLIEELGRRLAAREAEIDQRLTELNSLYSKIGSLTNEGNLVRAQLVDLKKNFDAAETDRVARGRVIEQQGLRVAELERLVWLTEQDRNRWREQAEKPRPAAPN